MAENKIPRSFSVKPRVAGALPNVSGLFYLDAAQTVGNVTIPAYTLGIVIAWSENDAIFYGSRLGTTNGFIYNAMMKNGVWTDAYIIKP